jgi:hypothetical protein
MHFGPKCHWPDTPPSEVAANLASNLKATLRTDRDLPPTFDVVLLSGDFTWGAPVAGKPDARSLGFTTAASFVRELVRQEIARSADDIILIPGNHDICWSKRSSDGHFEFQLREDAEKEYQEFIQEALDGARQEHINKHLQPTLGHLHYVSQNNCDFAILALNSTRIEHPEQAGVGYVGHDQIYSLLNQVEAGRRNIRFVAALHHHLLPLESVRLRGMAAPRDRRKLSFVTDAYDVLQTLMRLGTAVVLHGHMHKAWHGYYGAFYSNPGERVIGLGGAGSVSLGKGSRNIRADHHFQAVLIYENSVEFRSFKASLGSENEMQVWRASDKVCFIPDYHRPTGDQVEHENRSLIRKALLAIQERRIFDSVLELEAWVRGDARAREFIQNHLLPQNLTEKARSSFSAAFAAAEQRLATPDFYEKYLKLIEGNNPKLIERWVEQEMNRWQ